MSAGSPSQRALELAYRFIGKRERTEYEVRSRLERDEFSQVEIDSAVGELVELGYLDDARYARIFTEDRRALDAWGSARIARVLRERGVAADLISAALAAGSVQSDDPGADVGSGLSSGPGFDDGLEPDDELGRATALLSARFPGGPTSDRDHNRAFGMLARKGYESEIAADAVRAWARRTVY